jgi:3-phenylpropionate/trans-cinnamate dioxygenase ferredoxin reductase component
MQTEYLVLGAGPAGAWAIRGIRQEDPKEKIIIVGDEPYRTYSLPLLTKGYIQGQLREEDLYLVDEDFYEKMGTVFLKGRRAVNVRPQERRVILDDGTEITYGKLLISTGGRPRRFNIPGGDLDGIYYLRTLRGSNEIKKAAESAKQAIVIGGSFIGVELAVALCEIGVPVKLAMLERYVWQALLPEPAGNYLMEKLIAGGVEIFPEEKVIEFEGNNGRAEVVKTERGRVFRGDLFGIGIGLDLNVDLLRDTGVDIDRGVQVSEFLRTNIDEIYAAGDVAEFDDRVFGEKHLVGHIENAQFQGKTAGRNMAGANVEYSEVTAYDSGIFGIPLIFVGALELGEEHWIRGKESEPPIGSFSIRDGRIVGAFLIKPKGKDIRAVRELLKIRDVDMKKYEDELRNPVTDIAAFVKNLKGKDKD